MNYSGEKDNAYRNLAKIKRCTAKNIDSEMLYAAMVLFTFTGLEKKQIAELRFRDLRRDQGGNVVGIEIQNDENRQDCMPIGDSIRAALNRYLQYVDSNDGYSSSPDSFLFPNYAGDSGVRQWSRHLLKIPYQTGSFIRDKWNLNELKEFGIYDYYLKTLNSCRDSGHAVKSTAEYFRRDEKTIRGIIGEYESQAEQTSSGKPGVLEKYLEHYEKMRLIDFSDTEAVESYRSEGNRLINGIKTKEKQKLIAQFNAVLDKYLADSTLPPPRHKKTFEIVGNNFSERIDSFIESAGDDQNSDVKEQSENLRKYFFDGKNSEL